MRCFLTVRELEKIGQGAIKQNVWLKITSAQINYEDNAEKRALRLRHCLLSNSVLQRLVANVGVTSNREFERAIASQNFAEVSDADLSELLFAVGPDSISAIICHLLDMHRGDAVLRTVAGVSIIREMLFGSLLNDGEGVRDVRNCA